ncbi:MAG: HXXEE domain-containing protein [Desulfatitalea sp.]|nr:HXXEE domain-containing protein [Desulfatitalea sp.]NNK01601.1 HXXEE domain-containing protein [Desulfatitalea sp.]
MKSFFYKNSLNILALIGVSAAVYVAMNWSAMPVLQRLVGLIFISLVVHAWEEYRFPGGFIQMEERNFNVSFPRPEINELILAILILYTGLVPFFFPEVAWLAMAPMLLFLFQLPGHIGASKKSKTKGIYTPGLVTAILVQPIPIYSIYYVVQNDLMQPVHWLYSILYAVIGFWIGSIIIIKGNGKNVIEFIKTARAKHKPPVTE